MSFSTPTDPHPLAYWRRIEALPELVHLRDGECRIEWLLRHDEVIKAGRQILGTVYLPTVQGALRPLFDWMLTKEFGDDPRVDFLVILDREYWLAATDLQREILVYHELCHCQQAIDKFGEARFDADGLPVWSLRGHDVEEFVSVVQRYGAHNGDLQALVRAAGGTITQRDS